MIISSLRKSLWSSNKCTISYPKGNIGSLTFNIRDAAKKMSTSPTSRQIFGDGTVRGVIETKLFDAFAPIYLEVINESHMHNVPKNSETHFKVVIVSPKFSDGLSPVARHRLVHKVLVEEISPKGPVHALSIITKTPEQFEKNIIDSANNTLQIEPSPSCLGGDGSLPKRH